MTMRHSEKVDDICLPVTSRTVPLEFVYVENFLKIIFYNIAFLRVLLRGHQFSQHMLNLSLISSGAFILVITFMMMTPSFMLVSILSLRKT